MLRKLRIAVAVVMLSLVTFYFIDFAGLLPEGFSVLEHIQFVPAVLSLSTAVLVALVALTLLLGRLYCSVICPMGIFQDVIARISRGLGKKPKKKKRYQYSPARNILRYTLLAATVVALVSGFTLLASLLDPYAAYGRIAANVFAPVYLAGNNLLEALFTAMGNYTFYRMDIYVRSAFALSIALLTLLGVGYLAWKHGRTYCNTICPVGTFLGLISRFSWWKIRIDPAKCTHCGVCATRCKASCIDSRNQRIDYSRCVDCFDCLDACRQDALSFSAPKKASVLPSEAAPAKAAPKDPSRREFLATTLATTLTVPALMAQGHGQQERLRLRDGSGHTRQVPISPPGSLGHEHLGQHCTACHLCISKCPSRVLKPALLEYGLSGMMQPMMYFDKGFCNYDCTVCSDVCPNGAILPLSVEEKHRTQVGRVVFVEDFCIVHTDGTSCGACSEHCPTQAVSMIPYRDGLTIPHTNPQICVGCGGCEYVCPATPHKAIYVEGEAVHQEALPFEDAGTHEVELDGFGF